MTLDDQLVRTIALVPDLMPHLSHKAVLLSFKSEAAYGAVRDEYERKIYDLIYGYLTQKGVRYDLNAAAMKRAMYGGLIPAFHIGFADGAGDRQAHPNQDDNDWIAAKVEAEAGYISALFVQLRSLKQDTETIPANEARLHATWYARTLDGVYNEGKLRGAGNKMLTFAGIDGQPPEFPCPECDALKGKRHSARWWVSRGLVPGQPGNPNFTCGGWQCRHTLVDDNGKAFLIGTEAPASTTPPTAEAPTSPSVVDLAAALVLGGMAMETPEPPKKKESQ